MRLARMDLLIQLNSPRFNWNSISPLGKWLQGLILDSSSTMKKSHGFLYSISLLLFPLFALAAGPAFTVRSDHSNGIYALNEKVVWTVDVQGDRAGLIAVPYTVRRDGQDSVAQGTLDLSAGPAQITATRAEPGCLLAILSSPDKTITKPVALGGAVVAPEKIGPTFPAPDDFRRFLAREAEGTRQRTHECRC